MAYCTTDDLLLGELATPSYLSKQSFVDDAADEIDSYLGSLYVTPVDLTESDPLERPWFLLFKRLNSHLATGRYIMAAGAGDQDDNVNAYAHYLIRQVEETLLKIQSGEILIPGQNSPTSTTPYPSAPYVLNLDEESNVEAFYDRIANPNYPWPLPQVNL